MGKKCNLNDIFYGGKGHFAPGKRALLRSWGGGHVPPVPPPLPTPLAGWVLFFMIKQKHIRDKMRYSNLSNNMMISVNNNYNSNTVIKQDFAVVKQDFAVVKQVDGRTAHMTDTTRYQSWQCTPPPPPTRSCWIHPCLCMWIFYLYTNNMLSFAVITIFNPAPAQSWLDTMFYKDSDVFCANETEVKLSCYITV